MRSVRIKLLNSYNKIIALILAIIGFSTACDQIADEYGSSRVEYGVPTAKFIVKGNIRSSDKSEPIANIKVVMGQDSALSDTQGNYTVATCDFPFDSTSFIVKFRDVDEQASGEFQPLDTAVNYKDQKFINGDGHWYKGETSKDLNITMKPKK